MWKTQMGACMTVEKEATEEKTKVAVASIMHPAYRTTGMLRRTLASSQQQKADLRGPFEFSVSLDHYYRGRISVPEGGRGVAPRVSVLGDEAARAAAGEFLSDVEDGVG